MTWRQCVDARGALDPGAVARALRRARREGRTFDVLLSEERSLGLADAYRVQDQVTALRLADGERRAGWKLGYTSAVMRAQMGIAAPNFGPLTDAMLLSSPALLPSGALQPRVEPEIGLRLGRRLMAPCSVGSALDACDAALACLEIVDSVLGGLPVHAGGQHRGRLVRRLGGRGSVIAAGGPGVAAGRTVGRRGGRRARDGCRGGRASSRRAGVAGGAARRERARARVRRSGHHRRPDQRATARGGAPRKRLVRRRALVRRSAPQPLTEAIPEGTLGYGSGAGCPRISSATWISAARR